MNRRRAEAKLFREAMMDEETGGRVMARANGSLSAYATEKRQAVGNQAIRERTEIEQVSK